VLSSSSKGNLGSDPKLKYGSNLVSTKGFPETPQNQDYLHSSDGFKILK